MAKAESNYTYCTKIALPFTFLLIQDMNIGNKTVTSTIADVVSDIAEKERIDPANHVILYKDEHGYWDGWDATTKSFFCLGPQTAEAAMTKYIRRMENPLRRSHH